MRTSAHRTADRGWAGYSGWVARAERFLPARDRRYLAALLVPTGLVTLVAGLHTIGEQFIAPTGLLWWIEASGHLIWHLVCAAIWVLAFGLVHRRWPRRLLVATAHVAVLVHLLLSLAASAYHSHTGSLLDFDRIDYVVSQPGDVATIVATALRPGDLVAVGALCLWSLVGPWLVSHKAPGATRRPAGRRTSTAIALGVLLTTALATDAVAVNPYASPRTAAVLRGAAENLRPAQGGDSTLQWSRDGRLVRTEHGRSPRNVVMIVAESVRASATTDGSNGEFPTTPYLSKLARTSTVATQAYPVVPHTSKSLTGINCGVAPDPTTRLTETERGVPVNCLPRMLRDQGYRTGFFQSAVGHFENRAGLVNEFGYDTFVPVENMPTQGYRPANYFGWEDDIMLNPSKDWLQQADDRPFLLTYLTVTAHHDYAVPEGFETRELAEDPEFNAYLNTVAYTDRFVSRVVTQLEKLGLADDTLVVVVGDHGEGFGEHGRWQHDNTIYEEGVRVPLIVHDPTDRRPRTIDTPVNTTTIPATVLERLGYGVEGTAPAPALGSWDEPARVVCHSQDACVARIDTDGKYIHHFGRRADEYFDLRADPGEQENLIATHDGQTKAAWKKDMLEWRADVRASYRQPARS